MSSFTGSEFPVAAVISILLSFAQPAIAGEVYEPENQSVSQLGYAIGSRTFHPLDNQIGMSKSQRENADSMSRHAWLSINDRQAIARWIRQAEQDNVMALQLAGLPDRAISVRPMPE